MPPALQTLIDYRRRTCESLAYGPAPDQIASRPMSLAKCTIRIRSRVDTCDRRNPLRIEPVDKARRPGEQPDIACIPARSANGLPSHVAEPGSIWPSCGGGDGCATSGDPDRFGQSRHSSGIPSCRTAERFRLISSRNARYNSGEVFEFQDARTGSAIHGRSSRQGACRTHCK
jgi:hypothetical protein